MAHTPYKLICFDVDGTLIQDINGKNYWNTLFREFQGEEGVKNNRARYDLVIAGKMTYKEWTDHDIKLFQTLNKRKDDFERAARIHTIMPGARETVQELHRRGYKLGVVSGSLNILIDTLFPDHPFEDIFANNIYFGKNGVITSWEVTVFDHGSKHKALHAICAREGIPLSETVFVGDGENDIDILKEAGLGIAFCPKSEDVSAAADVVVAHNDLREILKHL